MPPQPILPTTVTPPAPTADPSVDHASVPCHPPLRSSDSDGTQVITTPVETASPSALRIQEAPSEILSDVLANDYAFDLTSDELKQGGSSPAIPEEENLA